MANYNKSFNFRNGVQVDTDKFIVNTAGLVGIGSTIPSDYLDVDASTSSLPNRGINVKGSIKATGLVTSSQLYVSGITTFLGNVGIGTTNIDAPADSNNTKILNVGIVTANFYYGSGLYLSDVIGFSTEAWNVVDTSAGSRTGLTTTSKIGIGTTEASNLYDLIIGSDPLTSGNQGISFKGSTGDIKSTGIIEASTLTGNVNAGIITGTIAAGSAAQGNITSLGDLTALNVDGYTELNNVNVTGVSTFSGITTSTDTLFTKQLNTSGISTFNGITTSSSTLFTTQLSASGVSTFNGNVSVADTIFHTGNDTTTIRFPDTNNISFETNGTEVLRIDENQRVGLGTANPTVDFQLRREAAGTDAILQVISEKKTAIVAVGDSESLTGHTGQFRYGQTSGFTYSNETSLDIINYSRGSINNILNPDLQTGIGTGDFNWSVGSSVEPKMTLTYEGNLGIGKTLPEYTLHVGGSSTVTGNAGVKGNLEVDGDFKVNGTITLGDTIEADLEGNILSDNRTILFDIGTGDGTDSQLKVGIFTATTSVDTGSLEVSGSIGIDTLSDDDYPLQINEEPGSRVYVDTLGDVGIGTDQDYLFAKVAIPHGSVIVGNKVGIGTTIPISALDVGIGGTVTAGSNGGTRYMIPPKVSGTERTGLATVAGGLIYNTDTNKLNLYTGDGWVAISTEVI